MNNEYEFLKVQNSLRDKINLSDRLDKSEIKTGEMKIRKNTMYAV